jgi:hypothetical protein
MQDIIRYARVHILNRVDIFTSKELECMAMDGIIKHEDIPENKRTKHSQYMVNHELKLSEGK